MMHPGQHTTERQPESRPRAGVAPSEKLREGQKSQDAARQGTRGRGSQAASPLTPKGPEGADPRAGLSARGVFDSRREGRGRAATQIGRCVSRGWVLEYSLVVWRVGFSARQERSPEKGRRFSLAETMRELSVFCRPVSQAGTATIQEQQ